MALVKIVCVLRSGGVYTVDDVLKLAAGVRRNVSPFKGTTYQFICLTDQMEELLEEGKRFEHLPEGAYETEPGLHIARPLRFDWPGWWSKIEAFRIPGPVLLIDLDTVIVNAGFANFILAAWALPPNEVRMLRGFYQADDCSGLMAWNSDLRLVADTFAREHEAILRKYRGDQEWLRVYLRNIGKTVTQWQTNGFEALVTSYKKGILEKHGGKLPNDPEPAVVCFHGKPKPQDLFPVPEWMVPHWKRENPKPTTQ